MLTPLDIENREFKRTMGGYNRDDVEDFMGILLNDYEILYKQNFEMKERIKQLQAEIEQIKEDEANTEIGLFAEVQTNTSSEELEKVEKQAEKLVSDAKEKANAIIREANEEIDKLNKCYAEARKKMADYGEYMKTFLQSQLKVVEEIIEPISEEEK